MTTSVDSVQVTVCSQTDITKHHLGSFLRPHTAMAIYPKTAIRGTLVFPDRRLLWSCSKLSFSFSRVVHALFDFVCLFCLNRVSRFPIMQELLRTVRSHWWGDHSTDRSHSFSGGPTVKQKTARNCLTVERKQLDVSWWLVISCYFAPSKSWKQTASK